MGTIKDIHDLISKFINSRKDRKVATEILQIQSLVSTLQSEDTATREKYENCLSANIELKHKVFELEKENIRLKDIHPKEISDLTDEERDDTSWQKAGR